MTEPKVYCPNCGKGAIKNENMVICSECGSFKISKSGEARPAEKNPIRDLEDRVLKLELLMSEDETELPENEPEHLEPEQIDSDNDDEEFF